MRSIRRLCVGAVGKAEVSYCDPIGTRIIMADGNVLPVEYLKPGMQFRLEDGGTATVTGVQQPKLWEPLSQQRDGNGNAVRRIVGTVKYTGVYPRLDLVVAGEAVRTTPSHLFYSASRRAWVRAGTLLRDGLLCNPQGVRLPIESISEIYFECGNLYNVEVEDLNRESNLRGTSKSPAFDVRVRGNARSTRALSHFLATHYTTCNNKAGHSSVVMNCLRRPRPPG